ncbi:hypothetical protein BKA65DRAFT_503020 [Rhexocercosporidium sp. MPI-PUGE-AT-0058]|nr:hypothetical protein BKA65DRAFT_503020 [Rhexocercosporidium sp. MPI-PUGE-AT-0058]
MPGNSPEIELGGTFVSTAELCERVSRSSAVTLGESNPFSLNLASAQKQAAVLHAGKRVTGHSALLENEPLWAYAAGGIGDDYNAHQPHDVIEGLRLGMMLTVMILANLKRPTAVVVNGVLVAENNRPLFKNSDDIPEFTLNSLHINPYFKDASAFWVEPRKGKSRTWVQGMEMYGRGFQVGLVNRSQWQGTVNHRIPSNTLIFPTNFYK